MRWRTRVAIQEGTESQSSSGEPSYTYANRANMGDIPATILPYTSEMKREQNTPEVDLYTVYLSGDWPVRPGDRVDPGYGDFYDVLRIQPTLNDKMTVLSCQKVTL